MGSVSRTATHAICDRPRQGKSGTFCVAWLHTCASSDPPDGPLDTVLDLQHEQVRRAQKNVPETHGGLRIVNKTVSLAHGLAGGQLLSQLCDLIAILNLFACMMPEVFRQN